MFFELKKILLCAFLIRKQVHWGISSIYIGCGLSISIPVQRYRCQNQLNLYSGHSCTYTTLLHLLNIRQADKFLSKKLNYKWINAKKFTVKYNSWISPAGTWVYTRAGQTTTQGQKSGHQDIFNFELFWTSSLTFPNFDWTKYNNTLRWVMRQ